MSKKINVKYTSRERKAEKEIDAFLESARGPANFDVMHELQLATDDQLSSARDQ